MLHGRRPGRHLAGPRAAPGPDPADTTIRASEPARLAARPEGQPAAEPAEGVEAAQAAEEAEEVKSGPPIARRPADRIPIFNHRKDVDPVTSTLPATTARNATLEDLAALLRDQHARKLDIVAPATSIHAEHGRLVIAGAEPVIETDAMGIPDGVTPADGVYAPTEICDAGIADKLGIPVGYLRRMRESAPELYDGNVNGWLHGLMSGGRHAVEHDYPGRPADARSFLVRCFRGDDGPGIARAFLSDRYGIVDNLDVLTAALAGVRQSGAEVSVDGCDLSEKRMTLRIVAPGIAAHAPDLLRGYRSPFDGSNAGGGWTPERVARASATEQRDITPGAEPIVFAGFVITNSETGGGKFTLTPRLVVQVCRNGLTITAEAMSRVHLGGRQEDGIVRWSERTQRKALELVTARTSDAVRTWLDVNYVRAQIRKIEAQAGAPVENAEKTIEFVGKRLQYTEAEQATILGHFIKGGQLTAGGVMQAVTSVAQTIDDPDRAHELEASALRALELAAVAR